MLADEFAVEKDVFKSVIPVNGTRADPASDVTYVEDEPTPEDPVANNLVLNIGHITNGANNREVTLEYEEIFCQDRAWKEMSLTCVLQARLSLKTP